MMNFNDLVKAISNVHGLLNDRASKTINTCTTIRNWVIGAYTQEYEQMGADRAQYGAELLNNLANLLKKMHVPGCSARNLRLFRQFYQVYPAIWQAMPAEFKKMLDTPKLPSIWQALPAKSKQQPLALSLDAETLLTNLSFTHFVELLKVDDSLKRAFYELECIKSRWTTRELSRQVGSLYYERVGLSKDKKRLIEMVRNQSPPKLPSDIIRDPYIFEFLGLKPQEIMLENNLRDGLVNKLQEFILELGKGFCFEARNKRILIGKEYYFLDLVFYHKVLKCNVILELKLKKFKHGDMAQLNTYLNYYKQNEMTEGDKPPIGILLCTEKDHPLVEYATTGIDNQLFVSEYSLQLPTKEEMGRFLEKELQKEKSTYIKNKDIK